MGVDSARLTTLALQQIGAGSCIVGMSIAAAEVALNSRWNTDKTGDDGGFGEMNGVKNW